MRMDGRIRTARPPEPRSGAPLPHLDQDLPSSLPHPPDMEAEGCASEAAHAIQVAEYREAESCESGGRPNGIELKAEAQRLVRFGFQIAEREDPSC